MGLITVVLRSNTMNHLVRERGKVRERGLVDETNEATIGIRFPSRLLDCYYLNLDLHKKRRTKPVETLYCTIYF